MRLRVLGPIWYRAPRTSAARARWQQQEHDCQAVRGIERYSATDDGALYNAGWVSEESLRILKRFIGAR